MNANVEARPSVFMATRGDFTRAAGKLCKRLLGENVEFRRRVDTGQCANEDAGPKEVDCEIPHRLERGTSVSKDAISRRRMYCEIPHRLERETSASEYAGS
ncbi:hypothetical protein SDJN02_05085, partial [Cucurbita argyrosperma subsp. argyrosperma]